MAPCGRVEWLDLNVMSYFQDTSCAAQYAGL